MSLDTLPSAPVHPTDEFLEEYSFGRVLEPALAPFEEHLLDCTLCQTRLLAIDEYAALMKAGVAAFERERRAAPAPSPAAAPHFMLPRMRGVNLLLAAVFLLVLVSATIVWRMQAPFAVASQPVIARLIALRGGEADGVAHAPSGRPLEMMIDRTDLPATLSYRLEVVSSTGRQIWNGAAQVTEQNISARLDDPLRPGTYWVRLYSSGSQLRREFGLRIE